MKNPTYFGMRRIDRPEIILDASMDLEKILSQYDGKTIGLVKARNLRKETRSGRLYHEGKLFIHDTVDDKGKPVKAYYVRRKEGCVPIDLGDGLFLKTLPTQIIEWSPRSN